MATASVRSRREVPHQGLLCRWIPVTHVCDVPKTGIVWDVLEESRECWRRGRFHGDWAARDGKEAAQSGSVRGRIFDGVEALISTDLQASRKRIRAGREVGSNFYIVYFLFKQVVSLSARAARRRWFYH